MKRENVDEFFRRMSEDNPEPKGELNYTNPYTLLVAVALSAQATDVGVNKATKGLFEVVSTPQDMLALGEAAGGPGHQAGVALATVAENGDLRG